MEQAYFRFYAELNDFLPTDRQYRPVVYTIRGPVAIKDCIESLGVPHTEVELILVNSRPVDFSYRLQSGDRVSVYPIFESLDISSLPLPRPQPLRQLREVHFVLDSHLGKLATYLRMLGFDALYRPDYRDEECARLSAAEKRSLLTRDRGLLKRSEVQHGYCVRETQPKAQLLEILRRFDLWALITPFRRCLRCNGLLAPAAREEVEGQLPPLTLRYYSAFFRCADCGHVYWQGSHVQHMQAFISELLAERGDVAS